MVPLLSEIEWLDAKSISSAKKHLLAYIPKSEGKHAAQMLQAADAPFAIRPQNYLGIGFCAKSVGAKNLPEFHIVVNLSVEYQPVAGLVRHWLITGGQINN